MTQNTKKQEILTVEHLKQQFEKAKEAAETLNQTLNLIPPTQDTDLEKYAADMHKETTRITTEYELSKLCDGVTDMVNRLMPESDPAKSSITDSESQKYPIIFTREENEDKFKQLDKQSKYEREAGRREIEERYEFSPSVQESLERQAQYLNSKANTTNQNLETESNVIPGIGGYELLPQEGVVPIVGETANSDSPSSNDAADWEAGLWS